MLFIHHQTLLTPYCLPGAVRGTGGSKPEAILSLPSKTMESSVRVLGSQPHLLACFSSAESVLGQLVCEPFSFMQESSVTGHLLRGKV